MSIDIGPRIGLDGEKAFRSSLSAISQQLKTMDAEMKAVTSEYADNEKSTEALTAKNAVLEKSVAAATQKMGLLTDQASKQRKTLGDLEAALQKAVQEYGATSDEAIKAQNAYNRQYQSVAKLEMQISQTKAEVNNFNKEIQDNTAQIKRNKAGLDDAEDSVDDFRDSVKSAGDSLKQAFTVGAVSGAIQSLASSLSSLVDETKEYQRIMGSLEVSSQKAGYSAGETAESYRTLYGVLADEQTAATTTANLQALGLAQDDLQQLITGTIGAWASYGDSIPIDGLAEAINETVRAGQVTGTFADVLNWGSQEGETFGVRLKANTEANEEWNKSVRDAKTAEDFFNLALQQAGSEAERVNLVMRAMAGQGLTEAGEAWQKNNEALVENNQAAADFQDNMAQLGERVEPITTAIRDGINRVLEVFLTLTENVDFSGIADSISTGFSEFINVVLPKVLEFGNFLMENKDTILSVIVGIGAGFAAWKVGSIIANIVTGFSGFIGVLQKADFSFKALNTTMKANIFIAIASAVAALIGYLVNLWNTNEDFRNAVTAAWEAVKEAFFAAWNAIVGFFTETIPGAIDNVLGMFQKFDDWLTGIFSTDWSESFGAFGEIINGFLANIENIWNSIKKVFQGIIDFITGVFTGDWSKAWEGVMSIVSGIWDGLVAIVKMPINGIIGLINAMIDGINWVIEKINTISFDVPDWVPFVGGQTWGFNLPTISNIPYLAKGGILSKGSAIVGEAGPELLTVAGGKATVQPLTGRAANNASLGGITFYIYGAPGQDVRELADQVMDRIQAAYKRKEAVFA